MSTAEVASLTDGRQRGGGRGSRGPARPVRGGSEAVRVVVLHGDRATRERLSAQLAGDGIEVAGAVPDVERCVALSPDVVVVVHSGADTPAVHLCGQVRAACPGTEVVVVAREPRAVLLRLAVQAGATGFVDATSPADVLCAAVRSVAVGRPFFDPAVGHLVIDLVGRTPSEQRPYKLTRAQLDVVALLPLGLPNRLIAAELGISENTVKTHLRHALKKLGVRDRAQAAALVLREGLA